jgi:hypothetical protein
MFDAELLNECSMSLSEYDEDDEDDDQHEDEDEHYGDEEDGDDTADSGTALDNAAPHEVEAHRGMLTEVMQNLQNNGIDVDEIADDAGISSSDIDSLSHEDLSTLTKYVAQNHPEVLHTVADRFPAAQGVLGAITGADGGGLGGFLGKLL